MTHLEELVAGAKAGNEAAFGALIQTEAKWAYATARLIVGSASDAEDVFQEACLRAWRGLPKLRTPETWSVWFRRVVTHAALDHARANRRAREIELPKARSEQDQADRIADRDQLFRMLHTLAPEERALLVLRFGHDLQVADIAQLLGLPLGTTKSKLHRTLMKLRQVGRDS